MALISVSRATLAFKYLWLSRFLRLKQCVPARSCRRRLVCQACVPLSPLCLPYSPFCPLFFLLALAGSCCLAWFPLLLHRGKLLSLTVLIRMQKRATTKEFVGRLRGVNLPKFDFEARSGLVKIAAAQKPTRKCFGKALQWSADWSAAVACAAASGQGAVFG